MNINTVKAIIAEAGGPDYILGFRFANGYKVVYSNHKIDVDKDFVTIGDSELIKFEHTDCFGKKGKSYIDVDELVQVYTRDDLEGRISIRDFME